MSSDAKRPKCPSFPNFLRYPEMFAVVLLMDETRAYEGWSSSLPETNLQPIAAHFNLRREAQKPHANAGTNALH